MVPEICAMTSLLFYFILLYFFHFFDKKKWKFFKIFNQFVWSDIVEVDLVSLDAYFLNKKNSNFLNFVIKLSCFTSEKLIWLRLISKTWSQRDLSSVDFWFYNIFLARPDLHDMRSVVFHATSLQDKVFVISVCVFLGGGTLAEHPESLNLHWSLTASLAQWFWS